MQTPKISVIVPLYKTEAFVTRCLNSILAQTFNDFEVICVDDCSPDRSAEIVEEMAKSDGRIRLIRHQENKGLGGARNTGIVASRGEYIASVDSDDFVAPDMLEALWKGTANRHFDVVVCGYERVDTNDAVLSKHMQSVKAIEPIPDSANPFQISNPAFWNKLWRRSLYVDNDIFFPNHIYYQDSATTPRIYLKAKAINFIGGVYYKYVVRCESVTNTKSDKHLLDKFRELDIIKEFLISEGLFEKHREHFEARINSSFSYHAEEVMANDPVGTPDTTKYLRHLHLLKEGYQKADDEARRLDGKALFSRTAGSTQPSVGRTLEAPRVLVLTMFSGENEFGQLLESLRGQRYRNWSHQVFHNFGNEEAHRTLYNCIMDNAGSFDLFIKIDADTVFASEKIMSRTVKIFRDRPNLDHLIVACDDFMTGRQIMGVHAFSNRVRWRLGSEGLFLDPRPERPGDGRQISHLAKSMYLHTPNPHPLQAFHFGVHRALKVAQTDRPVNEKRPYSILQQWSTLNAVWDRYSISGDRRLGLALMGADLVFNGSLGSDAHDYRAKSLVSAFKDIEKISDSSMHDYLRQRWSKQHLVQYFKKAAEAEKIRAEAPSDGKFSMILADDDALGKTLREKRDLAGVNDGAFSRTNELRRSLRFRAYRKAFGRFLPKNRRKDLNSDPIRFFSQGRHPVSKLGRILHKKYLA